MKDHYKVKNGAGPLQLKGPPQNKLAQEMAKASPPSRPLLPVHRPQKLGQGSN